MRNMSFSYTTKQIYDGTKTETTRKGWNNLIPGMRIMAVEKAMGLKKGQKIKKIRPIEIVKVEKIEAREDFYSQENVIAEGFPDMIPGQFIRDILIGKCNCLFDEPVNRITFKYVEETNDNK